MNDGTYYDADGYAAISAKTLAKMLPGGIDPDVRKFGFRSTGSEDWPGTLKLSKAARGGTLGLDQVSLALDAATMSPPWGLTLSVSASGAGGTWGATGQVGYIVSSFNAAGETIGSFEVVAMIANTSQVVTVGWIEPDGATGHHVWRRVLPGGSYASPALVATVSAGTTTFIDTGAAPGVGAAPVENTTGGAGPAYGSPPASFGPGPLAPGALAYGQMVFFWVKRTPSASLALQTYNAAIEATP